jgi:histidinol phosphatase-like enzyme (inositol monophosphatase family)
MPGLELEFATSTSRRAGQIALSYWQQGIKAEKKPDHSPVTAADRACESMIAAAIEEVFPEDGILGEEGASKESRSGRRWIIDPIDGTRDFLRGNSLWAVLIALETEGEVTDGVAYLPAVNEMYFAGRGGGAYLNGSPIRVSAIGEASSAVVCVNGLNTITQYAFADRLLEWMKGFWAVRSLGGCVDAMMVARGQADLWIEQGGKAWDFAALKIIVEEAGGRFFNFDGGRSIYGGNCVCCAPGMEEEAKRLLRVY